MTTETVSPADVKDGETVTLTVTGTVERLITQPSQGFYINAEGSSVAFIPGTDNKWTITREVPEYPVGTIYRNAGGLLRERTPTGWVIVKNGTVSAHDDASVRAYVAERPGDSIIFMPGV